MKSRITILSLLAFLIVGVFFTPKFATAQDWLAPEGVPGETYYVAYPVNITLDGKFIDWVNVHQVTVTTGPQVPPEAAAHSTFTYAAVADDNNLYFWVDVVDPSIIAGQHGINYWNEDSVELYFNATGDLGITEFVSGVAQVNIPAVNIGKPMNQTILYGKDWESVGAQAVVVKTNMGYAMEVSIPLRNAIWSINPAPDQPIGFQIQLNGASQQDRDLKLSWSKADTNDQSYLDPSVFGQIIFHPADAPASTAVIAPTPADANLQPSIVAANGQGFTVRDAKIYAPDGSEFVAKGTNVNGFNWVWPRRTVDDVHLIVDCWAFNLVRVNSFLFMGQTQYPQYTTNNDLDAIVRTYTERGVVVVFEGHDRIGSYYQGDDLKTLIAWFTDLARRYRDNPYVWFDVMNEPGGRKSIDSDQWVNMHGQVIQAIRDDAQANNIIIVEGAYGGQDSGNNDASPVTDSAILNFGKNVIHYGGRTFENIVFSIHTYDLWNYGDAKMADFFDRVTAQGFAMIVGEYGIQTDQNTQAAAQSTFNTTIPRGIGRIVWQWDGSDGNDLTTNTTIGGGWEIDNCTSPTNLSAFGQKIWDDNHS